MGPANRGVKTRRGKMGCLWFRLVPSRKANEEHLERSVTPYTGHTALVSSTYDRLYILLYICFLPTKQGSQYAHTHGWPYIDLTRWPTFRLDLTDGTGREPNKDNHRGPADGMASWWMAVALQSLPALSINSIYNRIHPLNSVRGPFGPKKKKKGRWWLFFFGAVIAAGRLLLWP